MDTWISGYNPPLLDGSQDILDKSGSIKDGFTTLKFSRKRVTGDPKDISITDEHCVYMMFPIKGGLFNTVNKKIKKHEITPLISTERICVRSCGDGEFLIVSAIFRGTKSKLLFHKISTKTPQPPLIR